MTRNVHDEARQLISLGTDLSDAQQSQLRKHLDECADCRKYRDSTGHVIRGLRSLPLAADARLVRATQMRVRFHASRMQEARQRLWFVGMACLGVGLSATLTAPFLWRMFTWIAASAGVSNPVWQEAGFALFWIAPALVVGLLLLARGAHLSNREERSRQWR
jgi:predicted anti-sigma-YlaC factor YlaD